MKKAKSGQSEYIKTSHCNLRIIIVLSLFAATLVLFLSRLMVLQIAKNDYYESLAIPKNYKNAIVETSRGNILDANGKVLVSNTKTPSIRINRSYLDTAQINNVILKFLDICQKNGVQIKDNLPVSSDFPYTLDKDYIFDAKATRALTKFLTTNEINESSIYSEGLYNLLCEKNHTAYYIQKELNGYSEKNSEFERMDILRIAVNENYPARKILKELTLSRYCIAEVFRGHKKLCEFTEGELMDAIIKYGTGITVKDIYKSGNIW